MQRPDAQRHAGRWVAAGVAIVAVVWALDRVVGSSVVLLTMLVLGPLVAAVGGSTRAVAGVALLASAATAIELAITSRSLGAQDVVRVLTVVLGGGLAMALAALRRRLERRTEQAREAERALRAEKERHETLLTALSEVGEGMVVMEGVRCVDANPAFERLSGYSLAELRAMESMFDLVEADEREEAMRRARLRTERDVVDPTYQVCIRRRDGERVKLELAGVPLTVPGSPPRRQLVVVVRDVTARHRAEAERERLLRDSRLLAQASALFDQSLDEERTLRRIARLCVGELADTCLVVLGAYPGPPRRTIAVAREGEPDEAAALGDAVLEVLRTGRGTIVDRPAKGAHGEGAHPDGPHGEGVDGQGAHPERAHGQGAQPEGARGEGALVVVPLRARGRVLGALAAGFADLPAGTRRDTLRLLEDLGRRAALALDNARLYEERSSVAQTLQRSLLPPELPSIPGAQLAARYRAAGEGIEVGGDFYDCFATGGGDWALVIGDVCGKGAEAAAVTALARYTLRASVLHSRRPRRVLAELNEALLRQGLDYRFCTVLYASVTPRETGLEVVLSTGGHPLPLVLRAAGTVETAGTPGTLLGVVADPELPEERLLLSPGDALLLYTDGVVEASPSDAALAPEKLAELLPECAGRDASQIATWVERKALEVQGGRLRDDVAVVVVHAVPGGAAAPFASAEQGVAAPG